MSGSCGGAGQSRSETEPRGRRQGPWSKTGPVLKDRARAPRQGPWSNTGTVLQDRARASRQGPWSNTGPRGPRQWTVVQHTLGLVLHEAVDLFNRAVVRRDLGGREGRLELSRAGNKNMAFPVVSNVTAGHSSLRTTKPWSFMLRMKFWPMTARPIRAMSALQTNSVGVI